MQKISFTNETPRFDAKGVIKRINSLSKKFRKAHLPVIIIQHDGSKEQFCIPNSKEWETLDEIQVSKSDYVVSKTINDSFYKTNLNSILTENNIEDLVITGCASDFCVSATVHGAIVNDYSITIVKNGHTTTDRPHANAKTLIDHYNWLWSNLTTTKGAIKVIEAAAIEI